MDMGGVDRRGGDRGGEERRRKGKGEWVGGISV